MSSDAITLKVISFGAPGDYGSQFTFNDGSSIYWDVTQPVSTAQWLSGQFGDDYTSVPSQHLDVKFMINDEKYVWAWGANPLTDLSAIGAPYTFEMPRGELTLHEVLTGLFNAAQKEITQEQYQEWTSQEYAGNDILTVGQAVRDCSSLSSVSTPLTSVELMGTTMFVR